MLALSFLVEQPRFPPLILMLYMLQQPLQLAARVVTSRLVWENGVPFDCGLGASGTANSRVAGYVLW